MPDILTCKTHFREMLCIAPFIPSLLSNTYTQQRVTLLHKNFITSIRMLSVQSCCTCTHAQFYMHAWSLSLSFNYSCVHQMHDTNINVLRASSCLHFLDSEIFYPIPWHLGATINMLETPRSSGRLGMSVPIFSLLEF